MGWVDPGAISGPFSLPPLGAIAAILLAAALPSILYLIRHHRHAPHRSHPAAEDDALPWRTTGALMRHAARAAVLVISAIFMLTPYAERIAHGTPLPTLVPLAIGCALAVVSVRSLFTGEVTPAFWRGFGPYDRTQHPERYRAALRWNGAIAAALLVGTPVMWLQGLEDRCAQLDGRGSDGAAHSACDRIIAMSFLPADVRARAYANRGRDHAMNHRLNLALEDLARAVRLDPDNAYIRLSYAIAFGTNGEEMRFEEEFEAAKALGMPRALVASVDGMYRLNQGEYDEAVAALTEALVLYPDNYIALTLRGIAYGEVGKDALARRDFESARMLAPASPSLLKTMADRAREREDYSSALLQINQYLRLYPDDIEAIKDRSDIYWAMGEEEKSRRDDDRAWQLQDEQAAAAK